MCKTLLYLTPLILLLSLVNVNNAQVDDPSLAGWWRLDEGGGTTVSDDSGGGNDGTLNMGAAWTAGISRSGVYLDGIDDFIGVPNVLAETGTVAFWFKPDWDGTDSQDYRLFDASLGGIYFFISKGANHADINPEEFGFYLEDASDADFQGIEFDPAGVIFADTWFHVAVTWEFDGGSAILYLNGEEMARADNIGGFPDLDPTLRFGFETYTYIPSANGAMGVIDEIMIYTRALAAEEIPLLMVTAPAELASNPRPDDEAVDVPRDVVLGWVPGEFAVQHDVYLGTSADDVNDAGRANPLGVLVSEGQAAETYDAGRLELGQTYYWRVDEVNGAPDNTIFKGQVWSFTVEPFVRQVENISATASSAFTGSDPQNTIDGSGLNADDQHATGSGDMWLSDTADPGPVWIQYDFDRTYKLHQLIVWNHNIMFEAILGYGFKDVTIEYSEDGTDWTPLGDFEFAQGTSRSNYAANITVDFGGLPARGVRLTPHSNWGGAFPQYGLSEVRFLYIPAHAREPQPAQGAADVDVNTTLCWRAGREAASHELYLGTDANALTLTEVVDVAQYAPGALDLATTYYWKVDEVNEVEEITSWAGDIWNFTTQEYIVVDDFESYTNDIDAEAAIYQTWIDGWINGTGSTVGHLNEPFAEQTVVHTGTQSMPLFYDNVGLTTAEAEYPVGQNWAASGIRSLSLYFAGDADNATAQMYVKINDVRVDYDGGADDLTRTIWQVWNIDLSTIGGNLGNVNQLTIGIEGAGATGVVYIDDIRLYPKAPEYITPTEPDTAGLVAHYTFDEGAGTTVGDASGNGNDGVISGDPMWTAGVLGGALDFSGDDYVDCGNDASLVIQDAITIACWIKIEAFVNDWETIIGMGDDSYRMSRSATNGESVHFGCNGPTGDNLDGTATVTDDVWHHIALVYDGADKIIYVDGIEDARMATTGPIDASSYNLYIGENSQQTGRNLHGVVDDARIYSRPLSAEEVAGLAGRTEPVHKPF